MTSPQHQRLHSSGGASHRYREVTGSNPVEVLTFSGFYDAIAKIEFVTAKIIAYLTYLVDQKNSDRMIKQLLNSVIAKYRDLSVSR